MNIGFQMLGLHINSPVILLLNNSLYPWPVSSPAFFFAIANATVIRPFSPKRNFKGG